MSPKIDPDHMTTAAEQPQRRRRKSDARESILNAAERLFGELGFTGCSLRNVADSAGVNQGMIHYFSKQRSLVPGDVPALRLTTGRRAHATARHGRSRGEGAPIPVERLIEIFGTRIQVGNEW